MRSTPGKVVYTLLRFSFQAVAVQQMYANYINHYMHYLHSAGTPFAAGFHHWNPALTPAVLHDPRQADAAANNVLEPIAAAAAAAVAGGQAAVAAAGNNVPAVGPEANVAVAAAIPAAPADVGGANVGPNPPNVVLNANAGGLGAIEDDDDGVGGQRDILDWFYVASRVLVLFSIVYFYSSLARFALVAGVCVVLYLYQVSASIKLSSALSVRRMISYRVIGKYVHTSLKHSLVHHKVLHSGRLPQS
jgi:hypothetical protein